MTPRHPLLEELDAADPKWQTNYPTVIAAVRAFNLRPLYIDWIQTTPEGKAYVTRVLTTPDAQAHNAQAKNFREQEARMSRRGKAAQAKGYVDEGDEV